jgi:hypothetical protein
MALTQLQRLELNKRVDKILHAPSNAPAAGVQLEMTFVADMTGDREFIHSSIKDAVTTLKSHDKIFQNVRSSVVYWGSINISIKVVPMTFIQIGKAFEDIPEDSGNQNVDKPVNFDELCAYLKLYNARSRCVLLFMDCTYEELEKNKFNVADHEKALGGLNPFLKYRLLIITRDKMVSGSELMLKLINS